MTRSKTIRSFLALGLAAAVLSASPAFADSARPSRGYEEVKVEYRYRSWESPGQNYQAIRRLAKDACVTSGTRLAVTRKFEKVCIREIVDQAVAQLGRKPIADLHFAATGRSVFDAQLALAGR